jgi:uncharacterized protein YegP (UPF0339 family)
MEAKERFEIYKTEDSTYENIESGYLIFDNYSGTDIGDGEVFYSKAEAQNRIEQEVA